MVWTLVRTRSVVPLSCPSRPPQPYMALCSLGSYYYATSSALISAASACLRSICAPFLLIIPPKKCPHQSLPPPTLFISSYNTVRSSSALISAASACLRSVARFF